MDIYRLIFKIEKQYKNLFDMIAKLRSIYNIKDENYQHRMDLAMQRLNNSYEHFITAAHILIETIEKQR